MNLLIVTGMSGAGKSQAAHALEDMGFYCVDNIPPAIIPAFVELSERGSGELGRLAIVTDARGGDMFSEISEVLKNLKKNNVNYKILFLDAEDTVLVRRYKENRRKHPLCDDGTTGLADAVAQERKLLSHIRFEADYVVDTSHISSSQLKAQLSEIFTEGSTGTLKVRCESFGFKYGSDAKADMVIDVRCLPNPFYIEELKHKTGKDAPVSEYVMSFEESRTFAEKLTDFVDFTLPLYIKEGKSQFVIAIGCTGGKHRSVTFAELLYKHLKKNGYNASVMHRDIYKT